MTDCKHNYDEPKRIGRAHYVCPDCGKEITLELVLMAELERDKYIDDDYKL